MHGNAYVKRIPRLRRAQIDRTWRFGCGCDRVAPSRRDLIAQENGYSVIDEASRDARIAPLGMQRRVRPAQRPG